MKVRTLALVVAAAVVSISAQAASISGSAYYGAAQPQGGGVGGIVTPLPAPSATFTVTGPSNIFNFASGAAPYDATSFLTAGGDTVQYLTGGNGSLSNAEFQFTGTAALTAGTVYSFTHDDGMILTLNGVTKISSAIGIDTFTVGSTGNYNFDLLYAEVLGPPATLVSSNFTVAATPEPSSIVMLGSGLLAGAGVIRRRLKV